MLSEDSPAAATAGRAALLLTALSVTGLFTGQLTVLLPALLAAASAVSFAARLEGRVPVGSRPRDPRRPPDPRPAGAARRPPGQPRGWRESRPT